MRQIGSVPDFDGVVARFLEWRLCHADQVARGVATSLSADAA
jgi:hypothetical protein